jgi:hypothetical protein
MPYFSHHYRTSANFGGALVLLFILLLVFLTSCTTARKVANWNQKHPVKAAAYCATHFPPIEWTEVRTDTLIDTITTSYPVWVFDTLYVEGDTVVMKAKCPPSKTITRTIRDTIKTRVRDSALVKSIGGELLQANYDKQVLSSQLIEAKEGRSKWRLWCLITWGILAAIIAVKLFVPKLPFLK